MFSQPFFIPSALIALLSLPLIFGWIPRQVILWRVYLEDAFQ